MVQRTREDLATEVEALREEVRRLNTASREADRAAQELRVKAEILTRQNAALLIALEALAEKVP